MGINIRPMMVWMVYGIIALGLGFGVLVISLSRTTLKILAKDGKCGTYNNNLVSVERVDSEGNVIQDSYGLPAVGMLPGNPMYGAKELRNNLWLGLSFTKLEKGRIALFIADKKIAEAVALNSTQKIDLAMEAATEALEYLDLAYMSLENLDKKTDSEALQLTRRMKMAGKVYLKIINSYCGTFEMENNKYGHLLEIASKINEKIQSDSSI